MLLYLKHVLSRKVYYYENIVTEHYQNVMEKEKNCRPLINENLENRS